MIISQQLTTEDHPEANGRKAQAGEPQYVLIFPLEDGTNAAIRMGQKGFDAMTDNLMDMLSHAPCTGN